jgi:ferredoxin/flavodoxin---NADP+ reductase
VETLAALGEITALYPEKWICDVAGFPRIVGRDLIDNLVADARQYDPAVCTGETVERLIRHDDGMLRLATSRGGHDTRVLLITAGIGAFRPKTFWEAGDRRVRGQRALPFRPTLSRFRRKRVLIDLAGVYAADGIARFSGKVKLLP